jgi:hypothetical protein
MSVSVSCRAGFYRSFIRAYAETSAHAPSDGRVIGECGEWRRDDSDFASVPWSDFRKLLVCLCIYATWYEVFAYVVTPAGRTMALSVVPPPRAMQAARFTDDEWALAVDDVRAAADPRRAGWAPYVRLIHADADDFASSRGEPTHDGRRHVRHVDFCEFAEFVRAGEVKARTAAGELLCGRRRDPVYVRRQDPRGDAPSRSHPSEEVPAPLSSRRMLNSPVAVPRPLSSSASGRVLPRSPIWARDSYAWS